MEQLKNEKNAGIVLDIIEAIHENAGYLSEVDGATGDGDHGINMNKGFLMAKDRIDVDMSFSDALKILGRTLVMDIGGSMGPIYGTLFSRMAKVIRKNDIIDKYVFAQALDSATEGLMDLAGAKLGDKTLIDTIYPAKEAFRSAANQNKSFVECLNALSEAAEEGKENTKNMVAKVGRAARLGERSKGFLDAGATSCCIILKMMASSITERLNKTDQISK
ncbi:MAG: dihydroxyacetone kinase subunit DhaL [Catenisphaera adipataccumulans]|jgi:dihydroxyacetone kinase-like protein|uniref:dihydroxyacetone kinase subunit DhaL n=1 Tax=Catenisphaera adipataccumulans TaxID=700500 RepID=UPI003D94A033